MNCGQCGTQVEASDKFCKSCGSVQAMSETAEARTNPPLGSGRGDDASAELTSFSSAPSPPVDLGSLPPPTHHVDAPATGFAPSPPPVFPMVVPQKTNGLAIAGMVLGILWIWWIGSILALVFGYVAKGQIDSSGGTQGGRGMAIAAIVLGWVGVGVLAIFIVVLLAGAASASVLP